MLIVFDSSENSRALSSLFFVYFVNRKPNPETHFSLKRSLNIYKLIRKTHRRGIGSPSGMAGCRVQIEHIRFLDEKINKSFGRFIKGLLDAMCLQYGLPAFPPWHKQPRNTLS